MNKRLLKFIRLVDGQPYAGPKEHETRVGKWLLECGFTTNDIKYQPYGINNPPDWIVRVGKKWLHVECKTSLKSCVSFNDTPPDKETLFVFSSRRHDDTMVFFGGDVYKKKVRDTINLYIKKVRALERKFGNICTESKRTNPYGFIPGFRLRLRQRGGMQVTDFFIPQIREALVKKAKQRKL